MPGFMNAEIEALRGNLECGHCGAKFEGSDSQARKVKYEERTVYCSTVCRSTAHSRKAREQAVGQGKKLRKGILAGPCKTCGKRYESRIDKMFCTLDCYLQSAQFKSMVAENLKKGRENTQLRTGFSQLGQDVPCLECGTEFYQKPPNKWRSARKFCNTTCYRAYMAKRFDRWVANPEEMALPQCYDEFLDREELPCIIYGCNWKGQHLTLHMNQAHGIKADEFKRAAGFNLSTGVVSRPLAEALREREIVGIAGQPNERALDLARAAIAASPIRYKSLEGKEHAKKSRAILAGGPKRICAGCGKLFQQSTPMGKAVYCSRGCRDDAYTKQLRAKAKRRIRLQDGTFKWLPPDDVLPETEGG